MFACFPRRSALTIALAATAMIAGPVSASVVLSNATTTVKVNGGDAGNGMIPYDGYFNYTDIATGEETTWSIDPFIIEPTGATTNLADGVLSSPVASAGGALSSATVGSISVTAFTELVGTNAKTTFTFGSTVDMTGTTFGFQAENDIFGFADDVAAFTGSIAGGDLKTFMYDSLAVSGGSPGLTVIMDAETTGGAALTSFGSGIWTGFGTALEGGDLTVLSADGSNFETGPGDLGVALAFSLSGTSATVTVNYSTTPTIPPLGPVPVPASLPLLGAGLLAFGMIRRRKR